MACCLRARQYHTNLWWTVLIPLTPASGRNTRSGLNARFRTMSRFTCGRRPTEENEDLGQHEEQTRHGVQQHTRFHPSSYEWYTFDGCIQRICFAFTMGLVAVALSSVLWLVSIPWISRDLHQWGSEAIGEASGDSVVAQVAVSLCIASGMLAVRFAMYI